MTTLVDANILLYAKFSDYPQHERARHWLDAALNGTQPVGLPWVSLTAFVRIATNSRVFEAPLSPQAAAEQITSWRSRRVAWHPEPGPHFHTLFAEFVTHHSCTGNLVSDAYLAAIAAEHGLTLVSSDSDFARFDGFEGLKIHNPLM